MSTKTDAARIINYVIPDTLAPDAERLRSLDVTAETAWDVCRDLTFCIEFFRRHNPRCDTIVSQLHLDAIGLLGSIASGGSGFPYTGFCLDQCEAIREERELCPVA